MSSQNKEPKSRDGQKSDNNEAPSKHPKTMTGWQDLIGQRVEEAAKQGAFKNLKGKGKPLDLRKNPFAPEGKELAFDLLQNNDLAPAWIIERKEVQAAIATLRTQIRRDIAYYLDEQSQSDAQSADVNNMAIDDIMPQVRIEKWRTEIGNINKKIDTLNLTQPIAHLEILKLRLSEELSIDDKEL